MSYMRFTFEKIQNLIPPCYVIIPAKYPGYGPTFILMGFDEEKQKHRLKSASDPYNKERFVSGNLTVITDVKFENEG